ncbi:MAG: precorrin-3B C(17)-methyltransferase [Methanomassiliicoccaceae archaeon]|jgi:precorrin-3B C17-methyltransferase|nr:precorrin-3B C(17)-methyltransferase [Methanomassiliicoccaceae archaeon]
MAGRLSVVGFGPGDRGNMTFRAAEVIQASDVVFGYEVYVDLVREMFPDKEFRASRMLKEVERCTDAVKEAETGKNVSVISSGDPGIYGMAGIVLQIAEERDSDIDIDIVPGITAASSAASLLGAPLMHDLAIISLSDLLTPLDLIMKRVECAGMGDMIVCLYNPKSKKRTDHMANAADILLRFRGPGTPVGIVRNIGRDGEDTTISTLGRLKDESVDMFSTVIIGNSQTYVHNGRIITPRGYRL